MFVFSALYAQNKSNYLPDTDLMYLTIYSLLCLIANIGRRSFCTFIAIFFRFQSSPAPLFSQEQEALLAGHINTMTELGCGYSRIETINLATDYCFHLGLRERRSPLSLQWLYNFLERWPELCVRKPRSLGAAGAKTLRDL